MTQTQWIIEPWARQAIFAACAFAWIWFWYLGVRRKYDGRAREPDMPLHEVLRWIARDSVWAARYRWPDDEWIVRVEGELLSKWQLGRLEIMGREQLKGGFTYIPPVMKEGSQIDGHTLVSRHPPWQIYNATSSNRTRRFYEVKLDRREVMNVWPRRSVLDRLRHKSPIERIDARGYEEIFRQQDRWYAENF